MAHIYLIGFMGAGKSTTAELLARRLSREAVEMDRSIEEEEGKTIARIFEEEGEPYFRDRETDWLRRMAGQPDRVVSCGGGAALREENVRLMKESGTIVMLDADPRTILDRVKDSTERPLLNGHMDVAYIAGLMAERMPIYHAAADIIIPTDGRTPEEVAMLIDHSV